MPITTTTRMLLTTADSQKGVKPPTKPPKEKTSIKFTLSEYSAAKTINSTVHVDDTTKSDKIRETQLQTNRKATDRLTKARETARFGIRKNRDSQTPRQSGGRVIHWKANVVGLIHRNCAVDSF